MQYYPEQFRTDLGSRRMNDWAKQLEEVYDEYSDSQITAACKKWLYGKKSKWMPYDRELKDLAGAPDEPAPVRNPNAPAPGQIFKDSDGYKYEWAMERPGDIYSFTWIVCQRPGKEYRLEV